MLLLISFWLPLIKDLHFLRYQNTSDKHRPTLLLSLSAFLPSSYVYTKFTH